MEVELRSRPVIDPMAVLNDPVAMRGLLLTYTEKVMALEGEVAAISPKADALDRIATADGRTTSVRSNQNEAASTSRPSS